MKTKRIIIILVIVALIAGLIVSYNIFFNKTSKNDSSFVGNTGGNLNNSGLFCQHNDKVYFANPYDSGSLYSMTPDENNIKKVSSVSVKSINVDDSRIYYALSGKSSGSGLGYIRKATGMYSMKHNGSDTISYTMDPVGIVTLVGNNLYYQHYINKLGSYLDVKTTDNKSNITVISNMISPASSYGGNIWYAGADKNMYLYSLDTATNTSTLVYERNMYSPVYQNGDIFYIDLDTEYELHRYNIATGQDVTLTDERVDMFNVSGTMIYYQRSSALPDPALKRMSIDGTNIETVYDGIYCDINITSDYVYFHPYDSDTPMYHTPVTGMVNVSIFDPGVRKK